MEQTTTVSMALMAYDKGFVDSLMLLNKALDTELAELKRYGGMRKDFYGVQKAKWVVAQLLEENGV